MSAQHSLVLIGDIRVDSSDASINAAKVEAGFALACDLSGRYTLIPSSVRDSFLLATRNADLTVAGVAKALKATAVAYLFTARIGNLVRSDVLLASGEKYESNATGIGYAAIRHATGTQRLADPAILASQQRALAEALGDSALFMTEIDTALRVQPAIPVVVGSVQFIQQADVIPWTLMKEKISASYDAVLVAIEALQNNPRIVAVDMETRDSIYKKARMLLTENYNPVSATELGTLRAFDMRHLVVGTLTRVQGGAELVMSLNWINDDGSYTPISSAKRLLTVDSKEMMRDMVSDATRELGKGLLAVPAR